VQRYEAQGLLHRVDGTRSPDEVHDQLRGVLEAERKVAR
jgi:hypothetical protein